MMSNRSILTGFSVVALCNALLGSALGANEAPPAQIAEPGAALSTRRAAAAQLGDATRSASGALAIGCSVSCEASVPWLAQQGEAVVFAASSVAQTCQDEVTYVWSFGDGTPDANEVSPTHAYATAGTYQWTLTATADGVECTRSGTIGVFAPPVIFEDGFEGEFPGLWQRTGSPQWQVTDTRSFAGSKSARCAAGSGARARLIAGPFSLADAAAASVTFVFRTSGLGVDFQCEASRNGFDFPYTTGTLFHAGGSGWTTREIDLAHFPGASLLGEPQVWLAFVLATGTASWASGQAWVDSVRIEKAPATGECALYCHALVPASAQALAGVWFVGLSTAVECDGSTTYAWDYGDGSEPETWNPVLHRFGAAGDYQWTVTATRGERSCKTAGTIHVEPPQACEVTCWAFASSSSAFAGQTVDFWGFVSSNDCTGQPVYDWDFGDGTSHSDESSPSHGYATAGTYMWTATVTQDGQTCDASGTITIDPPPPCSVSCSATVPVSALAGEPVAFAGTASATFCSGTLAFDWDFGDGSPHSSEEDPTHVYAAPGVYLWQATATADAFTCGRSGVILVSVPQIVPNMIHLKGMFNSQWRGDLKLYNATDQPAGGELIFTPRNTSLGASDPKLPYAILPRQVLVLAELYAVLHPGGSGADRVLIVPSSGANPVAEGVMKSLLAAGGEYSQAPTIIPASRLWPVGKVLAGIIGSDGERDSAYIMTGAQGASITYTYRDSTGGSVQSFNRTYKRDMSLQHVTGIKEILGFDPPPNGSLEARITAGSAWVALTHINNTTNSPRWYDMVPIGPAVTASPRVDLIVPVILSVPGMYGSQWRSTLKMYNPYLLASSGTLAFTPRGSSPGASDVVLPFSIPPGQVFVLEDAYAAAHPGGSGADRVLIAMDTDAATGNAYPNPIVEGVMRGVLAGGGEYTQAPTVVTSSELWPAGTTVAAILGSSGERDSPYIMTGESRVTVEYTYRDAAGGNLTVVTRSYGTGMTFQHTLGVRDLLGFDPAPNSSLEAKITGGPAWIAVTHINNTTNGPRWFDLHPAR